MISREALLPSNYNRYCHVTATERDSLALVEEALRIHAEGYLAMGFVRKEAITEDGTLVPDIDKSRGEHTEYYLALDPDSGKGCATMRKVHIPPGGTYQDLPAYQLCKDSLTLEGRHRLVALADQGKTVNEIAGMAAIGHSSLAVREILRKTIHEAIGKGEVWIFNIIPDTYKFFATQLGASNFIVIGSDVVIADERVCHDVSLRPTILLPDQCIDNLLNTYLQEESWPAKEKLRRSFLFYTDGLLEDSMSEAAIETRRQLLGDATLKVEEVR